MTLKDVQIAPPKNNGLTVAEIRDDLHQWFAIYFATQVTTSPRSQKEQKRDLLLFLGFLQQEFGNTLRSTWSPRASRDFLSALQNTCKDDVASFPPVIGYETILKKENKNEELKNDGSLNRWRLSLRHRLGGSVFHRPVGSS